MSLPVLIVDGYNIIGAWDDLKALRDRDMGSARDQLISILSAYTCWGWERIIVVFDGREFAWEYFDGVEVVFTGAKETADTMIERLAAGLTHCGRVEVATSDSAEYIAASGYGATVMSARALREQLDQRSEDYRSRLARKREGRGLMLNDLLNKTVLESLEKLRRS